MTSIHLDLAGEVVPPEQTRLPRTQEVVRLLSADPPMPFIVLIECRRFVEGPYREALLLDVDVEVGQKPIHDIQHQERIAVVFTEDDAAPPDALAVRIDFPSVPHLNIRLYEFPRSLCLSDQPFTETKLRWTARRFLESIRTWLALTAEGTLHQNDQPLEPLLSGLATSIILPSDLFKDTETPDHLYVHAVGTNEHDRILLTSRSPDMIDGKEPIDFIAVSIESAPHTHGVIRWQPMNLKELHDFVLEAGTDLLEALRTRLLSWQSNPQFMKARLILILSLPKRRYQAGDAETQETWGFVSKMTISEIGEAIDAWGLHDGQRAFLLSTGEKKQGESVRLDLLRPQFRLSRETAAHFNGLDGSYRGRITSIGAGALGSQIINNLVRAGFGDWTIIDDDRVLPHNLARHLLNGSAIGFTKASALSVTVNSILDDGPISSDLVANVLEPGEAASDVVQKFADSEVLLDMSASVAVARHLACDTASTARRISAFINPTGADLVVLAEDKGRLIRLDWLEMQYYRQIASDGALARHLVTDDDKIRYGHSCRDVSARISQELVALHGAIASRAVRRAIDDTGAMISVWQTDESLAAQRIDIPALPAIEVRSGGWRLFTDQRLLDKVSTLRAAKLPNETGGIFIGSYDLERRIVYVVDMVPSPQDSQEQPTVYIRGSEGLRQEVERISRVTVGWLEYVGEWHSHPRGSGVSYSQDDRRLFQWLKDLMDQDGHPPLMLIVAEHEHRWHLAEMSEN